MRPGLTVLLPLCAALGIFLGLRYLEQRALRDEGRVFDGEEAPVMDMRGLVLHQGEAGVELWLLKAARASMNETDGDIRAQSPFLAYYFGRDRGVEEKIITIEAEQGELNRARDRVSFKGEVRVRQAEDLLETDLLLYEGKESRLLCPGPARLSRPGLRGQAAALTWDLKENILRGRGGVDLDLETARRMRP